MIRFTDTCLLIFTVINFEISFFSYVFENAAYESRVGASRE